MWNEKNENLLNCNNVQLYVVIRKYIKKKMQTCNFTKTHPLVFKLLFERRNSNNREYGR